MRKRGSGSAEAAVAANQLRASSSQAHRCARAAQARLVCCRGLLGCGMVSCNAGSTCPKDAVRAVISRGALRGCGIMAANLLDQPIPRLLLRGASGLFYRDAQIIDLALDLFARQEIEPAHQDGRLDHRGLGAIEAFERRV